MVFVLSFNEFYSRHKIKKSQKSQFITLYKVYRTDDPPPIALIRAPSIIDIFVNFLFIPSSLLALSQPSKDAKRSCVWIFGYAASGMITENPIVMILWLYDIVTMSHAQGDESIFR